MDREWEDVTAQVQSAVASFGPNSQEIVHGTGFSLLEAMGAVELMDARMDPFASGPIPSPSNYAAYPIHISEAEVPVILAQMLYRFVLFCKGTPLPCSLYACYFSFLPEKCPHEPLRFCLRAILRCASIGRQAVVSANISEEDEFTHAPFSLPLWPQTPPSVVPPVFHGYTDAQLIAKLDALGRETQASDGTTGDQKYCLFFARLLELVTCLSEKNIRKSVMMLARCRGSLGAISEFLTAHMSGVAEDQIAAIVKDAGTFDDRLAARFVAGLPARNLPSMSTAEVLAALEKLMDDFDGVCAIVATAEALMALETERLQGLSSLLHAVELFNSEANPSVIPRSFLVLWALTTQGCIFEHSIDTFVSHRIQSYLTISFADSDWEAFKVGADFAEFRKRITNAIIQWLQTVCMNRAVMRRRCARVLRSISVVQEDASVMDSLLMQALVKEDDKRPQTNDLAFTFFATDFALHVAITYVLMGFELELYQPAEYAPTLYVADYLFQCRMQFINMMETKHDRMRKLRAAELSAKKNLKKKKQQQETHIPIPDYTFPGRLRYAIAKHYLVRGMSRLAFSGVLCKQIPSDADVFSDPKTVYDHRFHHVFVLLEPPPLHYKDYAKFVRPAEDSHLATGSTQGPGSSATATPSALRNFAVDHLVAAKRDLCQLKLALSVGHASSLPSDRWLSSELDLLMKVCDANRISTELVSKMSKPVEGNSFEESNVFKRLEIDEAEKRWPIWKPKKN
eukprot:ANDGO_03422.mRNA.1 N-alpha-acetyltransferase 35